MNELESCLEDDDVAELIHENIAEGRALGLKSLPSYLVNGNLIVGNQSLASEFKRLLTVQSPTRTK